MDEGIVTGEGVLLDTRPTSFASRFLASLIDLAALAVLGTVVVILVARTSLSLSQAGLRILSIVLIAGVTVVLPTTVETFTRGRSLGKLALGIRIVRDDGGPVRFRQAFIRALVGVGELWLTAGSVALISCIAHPQGKRVGDVLAGTYAVRVRGHVSARTAIDMPPQLASWAHSADVRRLPDGLALAVRQFLGRTSMLHPASRVQLGTELATEVARYVAPPPPAGTHPEYFLAAVLAERRAREHAAAVRADRSAAAESAMLQRLPHAIPDPVD